VIRLEWVSLVEYRENEIRNNNYTIQVVLGVLNTIFEYNGMIRENAGLFV
jgi:hypothetical protein